MYIVKTYLAPSAIEGVGVFAGQDISKGTIVWKLVEGFDQIFDIAEFEKMPEIMKAYLNRHAFWWQGKIYLCGDYGQFTNHSETPNTGNFPDANSITEAALRDIKKGEEITSDYRTFDDLSRAKLDFEVKK